MPKMVNDKKWFLLNVGGTYFMTRRSTIARGTPPTSPLHRIVTNSTNVEFDRDERGAYLIDRDPIYFQVILNYLRHGHLLLSRDTTEEGILLEAQYYCLPELIKQIEQRLATKRAMAHGNGFNNHQTTRQSPSIIPQHNPANRFQQHVYQQYIAPKPIAQPNNLSNKTVSNEFSMDNLIYQPDLLTSYVNQVLGDN